MEGEVKGLGSASDHVHSYEVRPTWFFSRMSGILRGSRRQLKSVARVKSGSQ